MHSGDSRALAPEFAALFDQVAPCLLDALRDVLLSDAATVAVANPPPLDRDTGAFAHTAPPVFAAPAVAWAIPPGTAANVARSVTLKVQHNRGGGACFPWHYDNNGPPNRRQLTCVVYLNPAWRAGDGGELALLPFLRGAPVRVAPRMDRAVFFRSDAMLHRVEPARKERFCFRSAGGP